METKVVEVVLGLWLNFGDEVEVELLFDVYEVYYWVPDCEVEVNFLLVGLGKVDEDVGQKV